MNSFKTKVKRKKIKKKQKKMDKILFWNIFIVCVVYMLGCASSCPSGCKCRGSAARCTTGFSSFPAGLDAVTEHLSISGTSSQPNSITSLKKGDFAGMNGLCSLTISYSSVQFIPDGTFSDLTILSYLSLADNNIQRLGTDTFKGLTKLQTLDISGNRCQLDKNIFTHILNIQELNLGDMGIQKLDNDFFQSLTKLKILKLYTNELKHIHQDLLAPLPALQTLDINGNHFLGLPSELKPKFKTMQSVHMSENPWQCNCQLLWFRELPELFVSSKMDSSNIVCNGPRKLRFHSYVTVPDKDFICIPPEVVRCEQTRYSLDVNHMLVISCEFEGDPIPQIKWNRPDGFEINGRNTASGKYKIYENGTLVINSVALEDDGDWMVTAYNRTAHDEMKINVHVIITTTSTTTTSTTTQTTPTTTPTTTKSTTTAKSTSTPTPTKPSSTILSMISSRSSASAVSHASSTTQRVSGITKKTSTTVDKMTVHVGPGTSNKIVVKSEENTTIMNDSGINYGLLAAAAAAGGTLVGIMTIIVMCCKKKRPNEKNKVSPFEDDFGSL